MKTTFVSALLVCIFTLQLNGQKAKDEWFKVKYIDLPNQIIPDDYTTYSIDVYGSGASGVIKSFVLDGYKRVDEGHLRIKLRMGSARPSKPVRKTRTSTTENKDGTKKTTNYYYYQVSISQASYLKVIDCKGEILLEIPYNSQKTQNTTEYTSSSTRAKNYESDYNGLVGNFDNSHRKHVISDSRNKVVAKFDFNKVVKRDRLFWVKKASNEHAHKVNVEKAMAIFTSVDYDTDITTKRESLMPLIDFWKKEASKLKGSKKKDRKTYFSMMYNVATTYYYLDMFDEALQAAKDAGEADVKNYEGNTLSKRIETAKAEAELHRIPTRHFYIDIENAMAPSEVAKYEEQLAEQEAATDAYAGVLKMKDGSETEGEFLMETDASHISFGENGSVQFYKGAAADGQKVTLDLAMVEQFTLGDKSFLVRPFKSFSSPNPLEAPSILEILYNSDRIQVFKYHSFGAIKTDEKIEFAFQKKGAEKPVSLGETQFLLFKKGLSKYFEDCGDLAEMATEGAFKLVEDDLIKAARIYAEVCE